MPITPAPLGTRPLASGPKLTTPPLGAKPLPPMSATRPLNQMGAKPLPSFPPKPSSGLKNPDQAMIALIIIAVGVVLLIVSILIM